MKLIITLLFLSLGSLSYGQNEAETTCNIDNYRDYIYTPGWHKCNLREADFTDADLSNANLIGANMSGANMSNANLTGANLYLTNFSGAILSNANLTDANLRNTTLTGADLSNANLSYANMSNTNLRRANLIGANLYMANLFLYKRNLYLTIFSRTKVDRFAAYFLHSLGVRGFVVVEDDPAENIINE